MFILLAGNPSPEVSKVPLIQRGRERETYEIAFNLSVSAAESVEDRTGELAFARLVTVAVVAFIAVVGVFITSSETINHWGGPCHGVKETISHRARSYVRS